MFNSLNETVTNLRDHYFGAASIQAVTMPLNKSVSQMFSEYI